MRTRGSCDTRLEICDNFQAFFIILDHANPSASMHLLVEIHNMKPFITVCNYVLQKLIG